MYIPIGTAVAAVEVVDDENCYCTKCFSKEQKSARKILAVEMTVQMGKMSCSCW